MFKTLPGFREFYPDDYAAREDMFARWRRTARSFGFEEFSPPVLEQTELFTEKSGEEIKSQLFEFVDKGGRAVSLRPEMTPSLARMVGARAGGMRRPVKWFAIGENYRYERQQKGRLRAFFQYNADILGEESVGADAEIIALAVESLRALGLGRDEFRIRLGDRKLWSLFLNACGVPDGRSIQVLSAVDKFGKVPPEAMEEMLAEALNGGSGLAPVLMDKIRRFMSIGDIDGMLDIFKEADSDCRAELERRVSDWRELLSALDALGVGGFVVPDLGIVRGLAYYTGFVFEAFQSVGKGRALAGGGRYDALVGKLGYQDMPAVGFGMGDVTVSDLLELVGKKICADTSPDIYLVVGSEDVRPKALEIASALRSAGFSLDYPFKSGSFAKQFRQADALKAKFAVIIAQDELGRNAAKVKNLKSGEEFECGFSELPSRLR